VSWATRQGRAQPTVATRREGTVLCGPGVETPGYIHGDHYVAAGKLSASSILFNYSRNGPNSGAFLLHVRYM
jgi:hypothetical protein